MLIDRLNENIERSLEEKALNDTIRSVMWESLSQEIKNFIDEEYVALLGDYQEDPYKDLDCIQYINKTIVILNHIRDDMMSSSDEDTVIDLMSCINCLATAIYALSQTNSVIDKYLQKQEQLNNEEEQEDE